MAKRRVFKNVRSVYYLNTKKVCDVSMKGTKPTSKSRYVKDIPCLGVTAENADLTIGGRLSTHVLFNKPVTCEFNPTFKSILCPPAKGGK